MLAVEWRKLGAGVKLVLLGLAVNAGTQGQHLGVFERQSAALAMKLAGFVAVVNHMTLGGAVDAHPQGKLPQVGEL